MRNKRGNARTSKIFRESFRDTAPKAPKGLLIITKRKRKSADQLEVLASEYTRCQNWSRKKITELSEKTGLSEG